MSSLHRYVGTVRFFANHGWLLQPRATPMRTVLIARRELKQARIWVHVIRRELAETRDALIASSRQLPGWWLAQASCIRSHEGAWTSATGNGYFGAYQFLLSTWQSVGGRGLPSSASPAEQTYRAFLVWKRDGGSWREWGTAGMCGLA